MDQHRRQVGDDDEDGGFSGASSDPGASGTGSGAGGTGSGVSTGGSGPGDGRLAGGSEVGGVTGGVLAKANSVSKGVDVDDSDCCEGGEGDGDRGRNGKDMQERGKRCNSISLLILQQFSLALMLGSLSGSFSWQ